LCGEGLSLSYTPPLCHIRGGSFAQSILDAPACPAAGFSAWWAAYAAAFFGADRPGDFLLLNSVNSVNLAGRGLSADGQFMAMTRRLASASTDDGKLRTIICLHENG